MDSTTAQKQQSGDGAQHPLDTQRMILAAASTGSHQDPHRLGYAVIDTGATETVGSLDAVEYITQQRALRFGPEDIGVDPKRVKRFKFGNAEERVAESFMLLPQSVQGKPTSLGIYTLDVPNVPILLGIKTMSKLGAVVNLADNTLTFTKLFPGTAIPLIRSHNGHLLLDLCKDWDQSYESNTYLGPQASLCTVSHNPESSRETDGKGQGVAADEGDDELPIPTSPVHAVETFSTSSEDDHQVVTLDENLLVAFGPHVHSEHPVNLSVPPHHAALCRNTGSFLEGGRQCEDHPEHGERDLDREDQDRQDQAGLATSPIGHILPTRGQRLPHVEDTTRSRSSARAAAPESMGVRYG